MRNHIRTALLATAIAIAGVGPLLITDVAQAQGYSRHNYRYFHRTLARHGDWVYSDRWGEVWIPNVRGDFRPYRTAGHWVNTAQYGWFWRSDFPWGDITFHYGRWVNDPYDGWLWIPGYVWSPGWVVWRGNNRYVGWMPMPPDREFLRGNEFSVGYSIGGSGFSVRFGQASGFYGYSSWYGRDYDESRFASNWTFVGTAHLADRDYRPNVVNQTNVVNVINNTTNITNYTVVNNYVVNRSVDPRVVARASGQPVVTVKAADVIKDPTLVTRVDEARQAQAQAPQPILRGTGQANSAPAPTAAVISTLSDKPVERNGRPARRLFNRETVTTAPLAPKAPAGGTAPSTQAPAGAAPPATTATPTAPTATPPANTATPGTAPTETGGRNRDRTKGGRENQGGAQGGAQAPATTAPTQNAPAMAPPANNAAPAENGGRNRGRGRGEQGNAPNGSEAPTPQNAPGMAPPANNAAPAENGGRNRGRGRGEQGNAPSGNEAPAPQNAPAATPPANNTAPAENGGRNRGRGRGEQGGPQGGTAAPAQPNAPTAAPAPESNAPAENNRPNRERPRRGEQAAPQNAPVATPPANTSAPDNGNPDRKKKKGKKGDNTDNQGSDQAPPN